MSVTALNQQNQFPAATTVVDTTFYNAVQALITAVNNGNLTGKVTLTQPATGSTLTVLDGTTLTGPAATDTLVGRASTDTLTNKTITAPILTAPTSSVAPNYIASETGANNAIVGTLTNAPALAAGLRVTVKLGHTLQAGANTFAYGGGAAKNLKSSRNVANDIGTAYAATGFIDLLYDGTSWLDMSQ